MGPSATRRRQLPGLWPCARDAGFSWCTERGELSRKVNIRQHARVIDSVSVGPGYEVLVLLCADDRPTGRNIYVQVVAETAAEVTDPSVLRGLAATLTSAADRLARA